jgi:hypothetical protein
MVKALAPVLLLALLLFLPGCSQPPKQSIGSYYEIVLENKDCTSGICFSEYMVTDSGLLLRKEIAGNIYNKPKISLAKTTPELAKIELEYVKDGIKQSSYPACSQCTVHHLFYHDSNITAWQGATEQDAGEFVHSARSRSEALFAGSEPQNSVFVQLVYKKMGGPLVDYHIFGDGTVVQEEFSNFDSPLLSARMAKIDSNELNKAISGFFDEKNSTTSPKDCAIRGFEYSSLEAGRGNGAEYKESYVCGVGTSQADIAFNALLALVEK